MGKLMMIGGGVIALIGLVIWGLGRLGFRGMPGDIRYDSEDVKLYFPIVSCLVLSVLLTLGMWLWSRLNQK